MCRLHWVISTDSRDFIKTHLSNLPQFSASACLLRWFRGDRPPPAAAEVQSQPLSLSLSLSSLLHLGLPLSNVHFLPVLSYSGSLVVFVLAVFNLFSLLSGWSLCPLPPACLLLPSMKPRACLGPMAFVEGTYPATWLARGQWDAPY